MIAAGIAGFAYAVPLGSVPLILFCAVLQGGANATHESDPQFDTADFNDTAPGNLRADYVLPRKSLQILDSVVL